MSFFSCALQKRLTKYLYHLESFIDKRVQKFCTRPTVLTSMPLHLSSFSIICSERRQKPYFHMTLKIANKQRNQNIFFV